MRAWAASFEKIEDKCFSRWKVALKQLRFGVGSNQRELDEMREMHEYNNFLGCMWIKYHYAAIVEMANKFRTKFSPIDPADDFFATLPATHMAS